MPTRSHTHALAILLLITPVMASAGVLAKVIDLGVLPITSLRSFLGAAVLLPMGWLLHRQGGERLKFGQFVWLLAAGVLLAGHWSLFFFSIRVSTVAVGMISLFTFPVMTALIEPVLFRERLRSATLLRAGLALLGVGIMVGFGIEQRGMLLGSLLGLLSAACYAGRNLINRQVLADLDSMSAMAWQVLFTGLLLSPSLLWIDAVPDAASVGWLLVLGIAITGGAHTLFLRSFRYFSVATCSVIATLQPVYGALIAWVWLHERPTLPILAGGAVILLTVAFESRAARRA